MSKPRWGARGAQAAPSGACEVSVAASSSSLLRSTLGFWERDWRWLSVVAVASAILLWALIADWVIVDPRFLPDPLAIAATFVTVLRDGYRATSLPANIFATLYRCLAGFLIACIAGIPLGLATGFNRKIAAIVNVPVQFIRPLPPLSYFVLLILWVGSGDQSKILYLFLTAFPVLVTATAAGVQSVSRQRIQAGRALGATEWHVFRYVILPSTLPPIFTGMRIALALAFSSVVGAEILVSTNGLGWMIFSASSFLRNDIIVMNVLILGILGVALSGGLAFLDHRLIHWRGNESI